MRRSCSGWRSARGSEPGVAFAHPGQGIRWNRRAALALALVPLGLTAAAAQAVAVLVVSRKRILNETQVARRLLEAEIALTAELQRRVDAVKAELNEEEEEIARLRATLDREDFEARVSDFDRKVRRERRRTQQSAAALQDAFRDARLKLLEALGPVLETVRVQRGASLILNVDNAMAADPAVDVTDEVIALLDRTVPIPALPDPEQLLPREEPDKPGVGEPEEAQ